MATTEDEETLIRLVAERGDRTMTSRQIAEELADARTAAGGRWHPVKVQRVVAGMRRRMGRGAAERGRVREPSNRTAEIVDTYRRRFT